MTPLEIIGVIVAAEGLFKAIDYFINKLTAAHDKSQKIDENAESLSEYIERNDKKIEELSQKTKEDREYVIDSMKGLELSINQTLNNHREEYLQGIESINKRINDVEGSIVNMQTAYQKNTSLIELKIENLTEHVNKHNNVIERTFKLEERATLLEEKVKVANNRIKDLEEEKK